MTLDHARIAKAVARSVEAHALSGVVSIRHKDSLVYEGASGHADRSNRIENTLATRFGIASGTKFFTALAIGKLIEAEKISFDSKLKDCVAHDFSRYSPDITIRHLLTHTSGIPDYFDEEKITDFDNFTVGVPWNTLRGPRDYLAVFPDEPMRFAPGERFSYSNGGYILLGVVIEETTGVKYQDYVEQAIFRAIGMNRSGYFALNRLPEQTAFGYIEEPGGWRTNVFNLPIVGASDGGAFTTVQDIAKLWKAFWAYEILPRSLVELYAQPYVSTESQRDPVSHGHGLWIREGEGRAPVVYLTGCDAGVSFKSSVDRVQDLEVTVISNTTGGAWPVLRDIDAALKGDSALER